MTFRPVCRLWPVPGAAAVFALLFSITVCATIPPLALAADGSGRSAAQENPRLLSLLIEIWPEYDRRAALVILNGELAADVALPAAVSMRIPASSGGPLAVAFATSATGKLFNQAYERTDAGNFITLRFKTAERFLHVEFYDALATSTPNRHYTYVWPGDLAVDQLSVRVQEPAAASNLSVQPDLGSGFAGPDGLFYRGTALGIFNAGRQLPIEIRYTKADSRTSSEILKPKTPQLLSQATTDSSRGVRGWPMVLAVVVAALISGTGVALLWWRRRNKTSGVDSREASLCAQCSNRLNARDQFCSSCGTPVRKS